jgi:hypothetical protein
MGWNQDGLFGGREPVVIITFDKPDEGLSVRGSPVGVLLFTQNVARVNQFPPALVHQKGFFVQDGNLLRCQFCQLLFNELNSRVLLHRSISKYFSCLRPETRLLHFLGNCFDELSLLEFFLSLPLSLVSISKLNRKLYLCLHFFEWFFKAFEAIESFQYFELQD